MERKIYAVIMAGGVGSRLWPRSRSKSPKQLLHIIGDGTMVQNTVSRLQPLIPPEDIYIVTNATQIEAFKEQIPQVPAENLIAEPFGRNTAPCVGLAATIIQQKDPSGIMVVLPADHWIQNVREFQSKLTTACQAAGELDSLVTMGITPTRPETGYGYIQWTEDRAHHNPFYDDGLRKVLTVAEKPDLPTAERFLSSGDFLWNSGMFIWRADVILDQVGQYLPDLAEQLGQISKAYGDENYNTVLEEVYRQIHPISIDYGIMEKAKNVYVMQCDFGWSDVGSWDETYRLARKDKDGNSVVGDAVTIDTADTFIRTDGRIVATVGVKDLIIVDTDDALLICKRGDSQRVQAVVDYLRRKQITKLL